MHKAQNSQLLMSNQRWYKTRAKSNTIEDSLMNSYNYDSLLYFCVSSKHVIYSKMLWKMVQMFWYYLHETISVHSVFGTCLHIGRAQDRWVLKGKDGCNSKRPHWRKRSGPFMPQLTIKPSSLENNEDLIIHEKKKRISNFHPNFMYKFYQSLISFGTMTVQDVSWYILFHVLAKM